MASRLVTLAARTNLAVRSVTSSASREYGIAPAQAVVSVVKVVEPPRKVPAPCLLRDPGIVLMSHLAACQPGAGYPGPFGIRVSQPSRTDRPRLAASVNWAIANHLLSVGTGLHRTLCPRRDLTPGRVRSTGRVRPRPGGTEVTPGQWPSYGGFVPAEEFPAFRPQRTVQCSARPSPNKMTPGSRYRRSAAAAAI